MRRAILAAAVIALLAPVAYARRSSSLNELKKRIDLSPVVRPVLRAVTGGSGRLPPAINSVLSTETGNERWDNCPVRRALTGQSSSSSTSTSSSSAKASSSGGSGDECIPCELAASAVGGSTASNGAVCKAGKCTLPTSGSTGLSASKADEPEENLTPRQIARLERKQAREARKLARKQRGELRRRRGRQYATRR